MTYLSPIPNHSIILPSTTFRTRIPTTEGSIRFPTLRLKARPHITIPSPLICANITGRGLERVVPVVVPVGGQVELRIEVDSTILSGCTSESESTEYEVKQAIVEHVRGMLFENTNTLAITDIGPITSVAPGSASYDCNLFSTSVSSIIVHPASASPINHSTVMSTIPPGHLYGYLTRLDLSLTWVMENSSKEEPEQQEHEVKEVDEGVEDVAAVMEGMAVVDEDDDEVFEWDLEDASGEEDQLDAIDKVDSPMIGGLLEWAFSQLGRAMNKLIKTHLISRFPLIFDGALLRQIPTFQPTHSLVSSLMTFLTLSHTHRRSTYLPNANTMKELLQNQDNRLKRLVEKIVNLPECKPIKSTAIPQKRRKVIHTDPSQALRCQPDDLLTYRDQHNSSSSQNHSQGSSRNSQSSASSQMSKSTQATSISPESDDGPEERAVVYLTRLRYDLENEDEKAGRRRDERIVRRVLDQAFGRIGRGHWVINRKRGKRGYRVRLVGLGERTESRSHLQQLHRVTSQIGDEENDDGDEDDLAEIYDPACDPTLFEPDISSHLPPDETEGEEFWTTAQSYHHLVHHQSDDEDELDDVYEYDLDEGFFNNHFVANEGEQADPSTHLLGISLDTGEPLRGNDRMSQVGGGLKCHPVREISFLVDPGRPIPRAGGLSEEEIEFQAGAEDYPHSDEEDNIDEDEFQPVQESSVPVTNLPGSLRAEERRVSAETQWKEEPDENIRYQRLSQDRFFSSLPVIHPPFSYHTSHTFPNDRSEDLSSGSPPLTSFLRTPPHSSHTTNNSNTQSVDSDDDLIEEDFDVDKPENFEQADDEVLLNNFMDDEDEDAVDESQYEYSFVDYADQTQLGHKVQGTGAWSRGEAHPRYLQSGASNTYLPYSSDHDEEDLD